MKYKNRGFTLLEIILYMALVSAMMASLLSFAWNIIGGSVKSTTQQEVYSQARYVSERIKLEIRNASSVNIAGSTFGASPGILSLAEIGPANDPVKDPTIVTLSGGKITIKQGAGSSVALNSSNTSVESLIFTNYSSPDSKTKHIGFSFTITDNFVSERHEYRESINIQSSAEIRNN